jgi:hypothetical protein
LPLRLPLLPLTIKQFHRHPRNHCSLRGGIAPSSQKTRQYLEWMVEK